MARKVRIGGGPGDDNHVFIGEDVDLEVEVLNRSGNPVDLSAMALLFVVRGTVEDDGDPLIEKEANIVGAFHAEREQNEQRAIITLEDTDLSAVTFAAKTYQHSLKRVDDGSERIIIFGPFIVEKATQV